VSGASESLGRKIAGAQDLMGVVRSMKTLAASSIGQYERAVEALKDYRRTVEMGLSVCLRQPDVPPPSVSRAAAPVGAVIVGSDQGLVGRFNEVLMEYVVSRVKSLSGKLTRVWAVGERLHGLSIDAGFDAPLLLTVPNSVDAIAALVDRLLIQIAAAVDRGDVVDVYVFHNRPESAAIYEPSGRRLLPLDAVWQEGLAARPWPDRRLPEVMDGAASALPALGREYLFVLLFQACAESLASENASRLAAMQRAEQNIDDILGNLRRTYHRTRQASIDEELFEVVSGYEAMQRGLTSALQNRS
jgi:F-type H+-transporting ATPase subunit gamma